MQRKNISYPGKWPDISGGSMMVRVGNTIEMSAMVASDPNGTLVGETSAYEQTKYIFKKVDKLLREAQSSINDVIRTRFYVIDMSFSKDVAKAHKEIFDNINPCTSIYEVSKLLLPEYLVAVEISAVITNNEKI
jgi:enamine deaminase RidA (YjgF/YER057c/UK114 family)